MKATVVVFASLKDVLGQGRKEVEVPPGSSVRVLVDRLCRDHPALSPRVPFLRYAANEEIVTDEYLVRDGDEIALMPPTSGG